MPYILYAILYSGIADGKDEYNIKQLAQKTNKDIRVYSVNNLSVVVAYSFVVNTEISQKEILGYGDILESLSRNYSLLPMRYGSSLASYEQISILLKNNNEAFNKALSLINNKQEYSLRILFSPGSQTFYKDTENNHSVDNFPGLLCGNTPNKQYLRNKYINHSHEEIISKYNDEVKNAFAYEIKLLTPYVFFNKPRTSSFILDAAVLIDKNKSSELIDIAVHMQALYPQHNVLLTGPWPAYTFTNIKIDPS